MRCIMQNIDSTLIELSDKKLSEFNTKLTDTKLKILGIKIPILRDLARAVPEIEILQNISFDNIDSLEKSIYMGLLIGRIKDEQIAKNLLCEFVKIVDNWATCDVFCGDFKIVKKHPEYFLDTVLQFIKSDEEFVCRVGIILLMKYYLRILPADQIIYLLKDTPRDKYYVSMAVAWCLAEYYLVEPKTVLDIVQKGVMGERTTSQLIRKLLDSFRVLEVDKKWLKNIRKIKK